MSAFDDYLTEIKRNLAHGDSTEHTHRPALKKLLESVIPGITATNEPTRILCGAPDFNITKGKVPLGHVETKDIGENLAAMEKGKPPYGEQFGRYRDGLPNWILTDYLEFRWYVNGELRMTVRFGELDGKGKLKPVPTGEVELATLLQSFLTLKAKTIGTAKDLAERMAGTTRIIRDLSRKTFEHEVERGFLHKWLAAFRETLIPDLNEHQFADMFAQTLAYGLFAARVHTPPSKDFTREMAAFNLPKTNPFLRKLFSEIAGVDMPETIDWAVDELVELLNRTDLAAVLKDFGKGKGKEDPVVHFYETFLAAYDPKMREVRGVYYTPEPVVSYIVRSVDHLLKTRFSRPKGLADENTLILDPATGTATFLYFVVSQIYEKFARQKGAWDGYVRDHLLNRVFGFELLIAPYAIAHLKLGMQLAELGYKFGTDQRLGVYLTNTLEEAARKSEQLFASWITEEANAAAEIKSVKPIMVVLGNPPYSPSICEGEWIMSRIADYKRELNEKKTDLNREEWKFLRFAQWRIEKTNHGIVAFIINNSFLDGISFRRMRECLLNTFSEIYLLDLHGSVKGRKKSPSGSDENVFDIEQGVTIAIFVKPDRPTDKCAVYHGDLWGHREKKYEFLGANDVSTTEWRTLKPREEEFFFVPRDERRRKEYDSGWKVSELFGKYSSGIQTKKDALTIQFDAKSAFETVQRFAGMEADEARQAFGLGEDTDGWSIENAIRDLNKATITKEKVVPILYRPFDIRFTYYTGHSSGFHGRPRHEIMRHLLAGRNLGLISMRQIAGEEHNHFGVTRIVNCHGTFYLGNRGQDYLFPLYLYDGGEDETRKRGDGGGTMLMALFEPSVGYSTRRANLNPKFIQDLTQRLGLKWLPVDRGDLRKSVGPEDVFHYAYAVFHSPTYRERYVEFLKTDFPRLPLTSDLKLFRWLAAKGAELVALHLMESPKLNNFSTTFPLKGDDVVEKVQFTDNDKRVWINARQYFGGVPKTVWEFHVGGYQVCEKWLKDRKGRKLSYKDIQHYQKVVLALAETSRLMRELDEAIPSWPII